MQNNIRNTNLRFNLDKEQQRRAWEYLQTMDRQDFKSYSQVISLALVDYFDRYLNVEDPDVFSHRAWELEYQRKREIRRNQPARTKKKSYDIEL